MILHYIKFAIRSLLRAKIFSLINILGLTVGFVGAFVILIHVVNEFSYDKHYSHKDRIYRVNSQWTDSGKKTANSTFMVSEAFEKEFPEIKTSLPIKQVLSAQITVNDKTFTEELTYATNNILHYFDLEILKGNKVDPIKEIQDAIISNNTAKKIFGEEDPIGKTINFKEGGQSRELRITALFKDAPWNSSYEFKIITNFDFERSKYRNKDYVWKLNKYVNFIELNPGSNSKTLQDKIDKLCQSLKYDTQHVSFIIQSLNDIYLKSENYSNTFHKVGNLSRTKLISLIGFLILFIAISNYIVLSTAKAVNRKKEIGIRKIMGASKAVIIKQITWESFIICICVIPLAILSTSLLLPFVSDMIDASITIQRSNLLKYSFTLIGFIIVIILLTGLNISYFVTKIDPLSVFRGHQLIIKNTIGRKILITMQIAIFTCLLISVFVINKQINYSKNMDLGYDKTNLYMIGSSFNNESTRKTFAGELYTNPYIENVSFSNSSLPTKNSTTNYMTIDDDPNNGTSIECTEVGFNFFETFKIGFVEGRYFKEELGDSDSTVCIINQKAVKGLQLKNPINTKLGDHIVIGVIEDFHLHTAYDKMKPLKINLIKESPHRLFIRINPNKLDETLSFINDKWTSIYPNKSFNIQNINKIQDKIYASELKFVKNMTFFSGIAVFLSIIGLFGLTLFTIEKRQKEIAIRKVQGATINNIMLMINKEFAYLILFAIILAFPIAWYFIDKWLQNFAYTISLPIASYFFAGLFAMAIVLLTVSIRSLKVALSNPIEALRVE